MEQTCLMLGAGHSTPIRRMVAPTSAPEEATRWVKLDNNPLAEPDLLFDLEDLEVGVRLPVEDGVFDEVHAYEVLEHFGRQGHYRGFFSTFKELWRVLRPAGLLIGTCPSARSKWAWGDPGHTRVISQQCLAFITKDHYKQLGQTVSSDYRNLVEPCWWQIDDISDDGEKLVFALEKVL